MRLIPLQKPLGAAVIIDDSLGIRLESNGETPDCKEVVPVDPTSENFYIFAIRIMEVM